MLEEYLESLPPRQRHHSRRALQKEVWGPTRDIPVHLLAERAVSDMWGDQVSGLHGLGRICGFDLLRVHF